MLFSLRLAYSKIQFITSSAFFGSASFSFLLSLLRPISQWTSALLRRVSFSAYPDLKLTFISKPAELPRTNRRAIKASESKTKNILQPSTSNINTISPYAELPLDLVQSQLSPSHGSHPLPPPLWIGQLTHWISEYAQTQSKTHSTFQVVDENLLTDVLQRVAAIPGSGGKRKVRYLDPVLAYADFQARSNSAAGHSVPAEVSADADARPSCW